MQSTKVLIDHSDYIKLKEYEKKYHAMKASEETPEQDGRGDDASPEKRLEKTILVNENSEETPPKNQAILDPITTPEAIEDIDSRIAPHSSKQDQTNQPKPPKRANTDPWYYIGIPDYKK